MSIEHNKHIFWEYQLTDLPLWIFWKNCHCHCWHHLSCHHCTSCIQLQWNVCQLLNALKGSNFDLTFHQIILWHCLFSRSIRLSPWIPQLREWFVWSNGQMGHRVYHDGKSIWGETMRYEKGLHICLDVSKNGQHKQWMCPPSNTNRQMMELRWSKWHPQLFEVLNLQFEEGSTTDKWKSRYLWVDRYPVMLYSMI